MLPELDACGWYDIARARSEARYTGVAVDTKEVTLIGNNYTRTIVYNLMFVVSRSECTNQSQRTRTKYTIKNTGRLIARNCAVNKSDGA